MKEYRCRNCGKTIDRKRGLCLECERQSNEGQEDEQDEG